MTQELFDLKLIILEGRYEDALNLIDELEGMSKQAILRKIESFLIRLIVHLLKNQINVVFPLLRSNWDDWMRAVIFISA